ncbi:UDP-N-acetylglucosamine 4,6-dehydratase family protein [Pseudogemmobacter faecipullorum]|nr:UDP-N-acetylglucosamine 4,6-dehydratase family protein [Pseudogemmobacter faecipullorum]
MLDSRDESLTGFAQQSLSEYNLYAIDQELKDLVRAEQLETEIIPLIGSVQNSGRVLSALREHAVETVYHAAAYKHVPLVEGNVIEGIRNNVFGTQSLAEAAIAAGVKAFILISTDKAVRPTNVMGASKRLAEMVCQALAQRGPTRFSMVRFGNVLGSSGSVIPLFRRQIAAGGPVTVTDPSITRYFMTIPEAAQLVIQAGAMSAGGEVFVLDMGEPMRIADLAARMIKLSGHNPVIRTGDAAALSGGEDIEIRFTGLRPGEKLYEELLIGDNPEQTEHPRIMTAREGCLSAQELQQVLSQLMQACMTHDIRTIRRLLTEAGTGYHPNVPL